jgi:zinc transport system substrate-binding protein
LRRLALALPLVLSPLAGARAEVPHVVATIAPVHSIVAAVMEGVGEPTLLLGPGDSPHSYSLRPSDAASLQEADLVFQVGLGLESFLSQTLATLAADARIVTMAEVPGIHLLPVRSPEPGQLAAAFDPGAASADPHLWLDPRNARALAQAAASALSEVDPDHATIYAANAASEDQRLASLDEEIDRQLKPVEDRPFLTLHDAFLYLEERYALNGLGALTIGPDRQRGVDGVQDLRALIKASGSVCIFAEPQFEPRIISIVAEGLSVRLGVLDPIEGGADPGPDFYAEMMRANAKSLLDCLEGEGAPAAFEP